MLQMLKNRPHNTEIALRVFNQHAQHVEESCTDSELILDFNDYDLSEIKETLNNISAYGMTPLSQILEESRYDFFKNGKINEIVMITDGQDTCSGDPCLKASELRKSLTVTINVIAVDVNKYDKSELICIPNSTGGRYYDIRDQSGLMKTIGDILSIPTVPLIVIIQNEKGEKAFGNISIYDEYDDLAAQTTQPLREFSPSLPLGNYNIEVENPITGEIKEIRNVELVDSSPTKIIVQF